jgi:sodium/pantothenate symporter
MQNPSLVTATALLLAAYMATILWLVFRGARKINSLADYALGTVQFSPVAVGLALAASMTSAATFIINPGFIATYGISGFISYGLVMPLGALISLVLLTKGFRKYGQTVKALSLAQWMGTRYNSKGYAFFFAVLALLLVTFIVLINVGLTQIIARALNADPVWVLVGIVTFVFGYMMFGGANSMVYTNTIQALLMLVVAIILLGSGYEHFSEGVHGFLAKLRAIDPKLAQTTRPDSFLYRDWFEMGLVQFIIGVAVVCQPHIITKALLLKEEKDVNRFLITGISVEAIFFLVVGAGLYARLAFPDLQINGQAIPTDGIMSAYVVQQFPVYVGLLVVLGLISAGISTLEGLIQSLSTTMSNDLLPALFSSLNQQTDARRVLLNKGVIVLLGLVSLWFSYQQLIAPNLSVAIFAQNGVYAYFAAAFVPVLFGMFLPKARLLTVATASATALLVHFGVYYGELSVYMQTAVKNPAIPAALALLAALSVGGIFYRWRDK